MLVAAIADAWNGASLVDKGLLQTRASEPDGPRFAMLHIVREYALEHLQQANDLPEMRSRNARFYADLLRHMDTDWWSPRMLEWADRLERELPNLHASLAWSLEPDTDAAVGLGILSFDLSKPDTTRAALGGDYPFISLWDRTEWINSNKDTVQHVVNAYVKTLKWISTHCPQEIAGKLPADCQAGRPQGYVKGLTDSMGMFTKDGRILQGGPEFILRRVSSFDPDLASKCSPVPARQGPRS
jgi:hypothetical protein